MLSKESLDEALMKLRETIVLDDDDSTQRNLSPLCRSSRIWFPVSPDKKINDHLWADKIQQRHNAIVGKWSHLPVLIIWRVARGKIKWQKIFSKFKQRPEICLANVDVVQANLLCGKPIWQPHKSAEKMYTVLDGVVM